MKPNPKNFCGGNYQDWLEVHLTTACNGKCEWCIDKEGWHPETSVSWKEMLKSIQGSGRKNIILLGGEPTLYRHLKELIDGCYFYGLNVYLTTNGSNLAKNCHDLVNLTGLNISIHHFDFEANYRITGLYTPNWQLKEGIGLLKKQGVKIRFNCNLIKNQIDSLAKVANYVDWVKELGADSVRFAELRHADELFVDATKLFPGFSPDYNPFTDGCSVDTALNNMPISIRLMCGLNTSFRPKPEECKFTPKAVLYSDGLIYPGWQTEAPKEPTMKMVVEKIVYTSSSPCCY